jgi:predicted nucleotidyltransferase component of viral defense system
MHTEALTDDGLKLVPSLAGFPDFVLAGGTALALQIGHRVSVDFDFFSPLPIPRSLLARATQAFAPTPISLLVNTKDELSLLAGNAKVTFLAYPFRTLLPIRHMEGFSLLSVPEIGATKAYTIGRRGSYRDYVDLYFIMAKGYASLDRIVALAEQKFGAAFNSRLFAEQLLFVDDVDDYEIDFLATPVSVDGIIAFFKSEVEKLSLA